LWCLSSLCSPSCVNLHKIRFFWAAKFHYHCHRKFFSFNSEAWLSCRVCLQVLFCELSLLNSSCSDSRIFSVFQKLPVNEIEFTDCTLKSNRKSYHRKMTVKGGLQWDKWKRATIGTKNSTQCPVQRVMNIESSLVALREGNKAQHDQHKVVRDLSHR
jgi:hypothetical protein